MGADSAASVSHSYFVFFRCWPGFTDSFPHYDLGALPDSDAEQAVWDRLCVALGTDRAAVLAELETENSKPEKLAPNGRRFKNHLPPIRLTALQELVRLASKLHWHQGHGGPVRVFDRESLYSPRIWLGVVNHDALANTIVGQLSQLEPNNNREAEQRVVLNPRFGVLRADDVGEIAGVRAAIDENRTGKDSSLWVRFARPFLRRTDSIIAAWRSDHESRLSDKPRMDLETYSGGQSADDTPSGFLGGAALADVLGVHSTQREAFFQKLGRQRKSLGDDCWHEVREPRPNSPKYLYRVDAPALLELAKSYKTSKPT